jgi:hypothetical protein
LKITSGISGRRKLAALFCIPPVAALAFAGGLTVVTIASPARAEAATDCLDLIDGSLFNSCPFTVEAVWCVENLDCTGGRFTNMATIPSLRSNLVHGGRSGNLVRWGACRGANTISTHGTAAYSWEFHCTD